MVNSTFHRKPLQWKVLDLTFGKTSRSCRFKWGFSSDCRSLNFACQVSFVHRILSGEHLSTNCLFSLYFSLLKKDVKTFCVYFKLELGRRRKKKRRRKSLIFHSSALFKHGNVSEFLETNSAQPEKNTFNFRKHVCKTRSTSSCH